MSLPKERIAYLLEVYTSQKATAQEEQELLDWMQDAQEDSELKTYMHGLWESQEQPRDFNRVNWEKMYENVMSSDRVISIAPEVKTRVSYWPRIAAAVVLILVSYSIYLLVKRPDTKPLSEKIGEPVVPATVAPPDKTNATLTLANGKVIVLGSAANGNLGGEGVGNANKLSDERLVYAASNEAAVEYQTLSVPKGSKPIHLTLADGSEVWLNSASSINFPNIFQGNNRTVSITGEAYFEVAKMASKPFLVNINQQVQVEVLGTHFNINAYGNEPALKTTLLEGSIRFRSAGSNRQSGQQEVVLLPGQQSQLNLSSNKLVVESDVETDKVMAWKNGIFDFNDASVREVMNQLERWYDIDVIYEKGIPAISFYGKMTKNISLNDLLVILEKSKVKFRIEGKKLMVQP